jgi:hypothetical protein
MSDARDSIIHSRTRVGGLSDETILNQRGDWHGHERLNLVPKELEWSSAVGATTDSLKKERNRDATTGRVAEIDVTLAQLSGLSNMNPEDRNITLRGLVNNDRLFKQLETESSNVRKFALGGFSPAVIDLQRKVIASVDKLSGHALSFEASSIKTAMQGNVDPKVSELLGRDLEDKRWQMASPFVERARLASFFIQNKMPYRAELALQETLNQDIPTEALSSVIIRSLRDDTQQQLISFRVENNLVSTYNEHLPALDLNNDGKVSLDELKNRPQSRDTTLSSLFTFLQNNYKYLDRKNAGAITQADVIAYARDRLSKINERHFE